ncbi:MAG: helix-turn-helix domain-containing protein [Clostridium sp.]|nr:helix-turn-helix domain-containing protein [Clostridium sp.]MCM1444160.1 helix-turn-helix domain-containing protein [Candidatus Amulumruptor caecigallinarius]
MIGKILKTMRKLKGMTQTNLSNMTGIPQNTISQYETGRIEPTFEIITKISNACEFEIEFKGKSCTLTSNNINRKEL